MALAIQRATGLISSSVGQVAFNPIVSAALLWVLTKAPASLRSRFINGSGILKDPKHFVRIIKALKVCLALGVTGVVNRQLNDISLNNGRWTATSEKKRWNWEKELAVITGGCSGIGELTVKGLIAKGVKVAILDIRDLPPSLQGRKFLPYPSLPLSMCNNPP